MAATRKPDPKAAALKQSGTLNAHAKQVRDPAFSDSDFFDPRDVVQVRYEMLRRVTIEGAAIATAATDFAVSRPTFYKAQAAFARAGLVGLLPAKRGPHAPHKITAEVLRFIEELRAADAGLQVEALIVRIAERFGVRVHRRTVERALARRKKKRP